MASWGAIGLSALGIVWSAAMQIAKNDQQDVILAAHKASIEQLQAWRTMDREAVIGMRSDLQFLVDAEKERRRQ
jgi:hypothetical protein